MGLSNARYASATVIGNIVNGICNPIIGFLMDKRIFKRKYTPWVMIGSLGSVLSYLILYIIPWTPAVNSKSVAWFTAMIMVVLAGLFHAIQVINGGCIFSALTMKGRERILAKILSGWIGGFGRLFGKMIFPVVFAYFTAKLGDARGYFPTAAVLGIFFIVFVLVRVREIKLFIPGDIEGITVCAETGKHTSDDAIPAKEMITNLLKNYPMFVLILSSVVNMTRRTFASSFNSIYAKYVAGDIRWLSVLAGVSAMISPAVRIIGPAIALFIGDHKTVNVIAKIGSAFLSIGLSIFGQKPWEWVGIRAANGLFNNLGTLTTSVLKAGAVDFGELKNGVRHPGMIMALSGVGANIGQAAGIMLRSYFLEKAGFKPGFIPDEEFKNKLMKGFAISGAMGLVNGLLLQFFYPMNKKKLDEVRELVEKQREANNAKNKDKSEANDQ